MNMTWNKASMTMSLILAAALAGCGGGASDSTDASAGSPSAGATLAPRVVASAAQAGTLSSYESASLGFMREEEQLAHDVYALSAGLWQQAVFDNISRSESSHVSAVKSLLDRYQLPDPLAATPAGVFATPALQAMYDRLAQASRVSMMDALKVGVEIEERDIADIREHMAGIDNPDILQVYDNLLRGSRNHLRAFVSVLSAQGGAYVPQYIPQEEFDAIVNSPQESGR